MSTYFRINLNPYDSHTTIPDNEDKSLHPYGPFKSYTWDDMGDSRYVVSLHKPWHMIRDNMTPCFGNLHAHITRDSRDCDGSYNSDNVQIAKDTRFNASREKVNLDKDSDGFDWDAYEPCTNEAEFRYSILDLDEEGNSYRFKQDDNDTFHRARGTDEGYEYTEVVFCYDWSCDLGHRYYRDHSAEAAGY